MSYSYETRTYLSTPITIKLFSELGTIEKQNLINSAFAEFERIGRLYTRFGSSSELINLNQSLGREYKLSPEFNSMVKFALELAADTLGRFDPTIIDLLEMHGYTDSFNPQKIAKTIVNPAEVSATSKTRANWKDISYEQDKRLIKLATGQRLDLGSIGKGWAIKCAAAVLATQSENFLIDAGGDIYAKGINQETRQPWTVNLEYRRTKNSTVLSIGQIELNPEGQSVASSGSWARATGKFHHLLDPLTGQPSNTNIQTFVIHKDPFIADGLATAVFLTPRQMHDNLLSKYSALAIVIDFQERIWASPGLKLSV